MKSPEDIIHQYQDAFPQIVDMAAASEVFWQNPHRMPWSDAKQQLELTNADEQEATDRLARFASYLASRFPETRASDGIIESRLMDAPNTLSKLEAYYGQVLSGRLMLKLDCDLPIAGSIKARGGIYEVLKYAESLATEQGLITESDDYATFDSQIFRDFFSDYSIVVGSTGNLGLSIGIMGASLGLKTTVHMSADARQWKKELLRAKGVIVIEYEDDYSHAVEQGRQASSQDPNSHFVDDESSKDLFLGYAVAARRLKAQLDEKTITVDAEHPLYVYIPCGVGGGPGGICFGLKLVFGDNVHCYFVEPTHAPAVLLGLGTGKHENISAQDIGLDGITAADGLAVSRASGLACRMMAPLLDGIYTLNDPELFKLLKIVFDGNGVKVEPSAASSLAGLSKITTTSVNLNKNATHIAWITGGSLVPNDEWEAYYKV